MTKKRRHIVLINKDFQFKLISKFVIVNIIIMIIFGCIFYIFLNSEVESNLYSAHVTYKNIKDMLFPVIITMSVINILVSSTIISMFVLIASHKVAGPLYRFNEALKDISNRNFQTITDVRDGDQLYECSRTLSSTANILKEDISAVKLIMNEMKDSCKMEIRKEDMISRVEHMENIISRYKL